MCVRLLYEGWVLLAVLYIATGIEYIASRLCDNEGDGGDGDGEVELKINFNTNCHPLCSDGFSVKEATVACRELGRPTDRVYITHHERNVTRKGMVPLHEPRCSGGETTLSSCYWGKLQTCRHEYVGVICSKNSTQVREVQSVTLDKKNIRVYNGSNVTVTCTATGELHASHYWYKWTLNGTVVAMAPSVTLTLYKRHNNQTLNCSVYERDALLQKESVTLQVYYPPKSSDEVLKLDVLRGTNINLALPVSSNPPPNNYTLRILESNAAVTLSNHQTEIRNIQKNQSGMYIVTMKNWMGVTEGIPMAGHGYKLVKINVFELSCKKEVFVVENSTTTTTLRCVNLARDNLNVTWNSPKNASSHKLTYDISNPTQEDNGTYTCSINYTIDGDGVRTGNCSTTVHVLAQPEEIVNCTINSTLTLQDFTNITENYKWKKMDGNQLRDHDNFPSIKHVSKRDAGIYVGTYQTSTVTIKLQVLYAPNVTCDQRVFIPIGKSRRLTCSIDAFPLATKVSWSQTRCPKADSALHESSETSCTIDKAQMEDNGSVYNCTVENTEGTDTCTITVSVYDNTRTNYLVVGIVSGVFSILLAAMLVVILLLARLVYRGRRGRRGRDRKNSTIPLPVLPSAAQVKEAEGATRRPLPTAPAKVDDNDFQQDVYENA